MANKSAKSTRNWTQSRFGLVLGGLAAGLLAYLFASLAIDTGFWWQYLLAIICLVVVIRNFVRALTIHAKD